MKLGYEKTSSVVVVITTLISVFVTTFILAAVGTAGVSVDDADAKPKISKKDQKNQRSVKVPDLSKQKQDQSGCGVVCPPADKYGGSCTSDCDPKIPIELPPPSDGGPRGPIRDLGDTDTNTLP